MDNGVLRKQAEYGCYHCVKNSQGLSQCSMHYVRYDVLYSFVFSRLQYRIGAVQQDEQAIIARLSKSSVTEQASATKRAAQEKKRAEKWLNELDNLLAKLYEDRASVLCGRSERLRGGHWGGLSPQSAASSIRSAPPPALWAIKISSR